MYSFLGCEVLCSPNMKDNIPSQTTNLYATSAVSHLEKHFNSDRYTLDSNISKFTLNNFRKILAILKNLFMFNKILKNI